MTLQLGSFTPLPTSRDGFVDLSLEVVEQGECRNGRKTTELAVKRVDAVLTRNAAARKYEGGEKELASLASRLQ